MPERQEFLRLASDPQYQQQQLMAAAAAVTAAVPSLRSKGPNCSSERPSPTGMFLGPMGCTPVSKGYGARVPSGTPQGQQGAHGVPVKQDIGLSATPATHQPSGPVPVGLMGHMGAYHQPNVHALQGPLVPAGNLLGEGRVLSFAQVEAEQQQKQQILQQQHFGEQELQQQQHVRELLLQQHRQLQQQQQHVEEEQKQKQKQDHQLLQQQQQQRQERQLLQMQQHLQQLQAQGDKRDHHQAPEAPIPSSGPIASIQRPPPSPQGIPQSCLDSPTLQGASLPMTRANLAAMSGASVGGGAPALPLGAPPLPGVTMLPLNTSPLSGVTTLGPESMILCSVQQLQAALNTQDHAAAPLGGLPAILSSLLGSGAVILPPVQTLPPQGGLTQTSCLPLPPQGSFLMPSSLPLSTQGGVILPSAVSSATNPTFTQDKGIMGQPTTNTATSVPFFTYPMGGQGGVSIQQLTSAEWGALRSSSVVQIGGQTTQQQ